MRGVNLGAEAVTLGKRGDEMGIPIPGAYASPRISNGVLCWYAGDTFEIAIQIDLEDQDGEHVEITAADCVRITFYDETRETVHTETFSKIAGNTVTLTVDTEVSAKFPRGLYSYDIAFLHGNRTTLARDNRIRVE